MCAYAITFVFACGSRTGLLDSAETPDDASLIPDSSDATRGDSAIMPKDTSVPDTLSFTDAGVETNLDAIAYSPYPPIDPTLPDAAPSYCTEGGTTGAYLIALSGSVYSFDPISRVGVKVGILDCPAPTTAQPYTMTVAQTGAYVLFTDWSIYHFDPPSLLCTKTNYQTGQLSLSDDLKIATFEQDGSDQLLVFGCMLSKAPCTAVLAKGDFSTFALSLIGPVSPDPEQGVSLELKVDAYGRGFAVDPQELIMSVDVHTGDLTGVDYLHGLTNGPAWTFLMSGEKAYIFTGPTGTVTQYDFSTKILTTVGSIGEPIAGAGAPPCD